MVASSDSLPEYQGEKSSLKVSDSDQTLSDTTTIPVNDVVAYNVRGSAGKSRPRPPPCPPLKQTPLGMIKSAVEQIGMHIPWFWPGFYKIV